MMERQKKCHHNGEKDENRCGMALYSAYAGKTPALHCHKTIRL